MKAQLDNPMDREAISALMDGQLRGTEAAVALQTLASSEARECWQLYHLVGDVLRSSDLAACGRDDTFVSRLSARLQQESQAGAVVPAPSVAELRDVARPAANDSVFRWKMVAGLASFAAVAAIGWSVLGGLGPQPGAGAQLAQGAVPVPGQAQVVTLMAPAATATPPAANAGAVMLRDPRLDELLAAHRQSAGASALGDAAGFLRNATFEGPGR